MGHKIYFLLTGVQGKAESGQCKVLSADSVNPDESRASVLVLVNSDTGPPGLDLRQPGGSRDFCVKKHFSNQCSRINGNGLQSAWDLPTTYAKHRVKDAKVFHTIFSLPRRIQRFPDFLP